MGSDSAYCQSLLVIDAVVWTPPPSPTPSCPATNPWSDLYRRCLPPVDPSIAPLDLSHLTADAASAIEQCNITDPAREIVAAGKIPHARDAWKYVPVSKNQIEFQHDGPVWLIQLRGDRVFPTPTGAAPGAGVFHNPLCFVGPESGITDVSNPANTAADMIWSLPAPIGAPGASPSPS